MVDFLFIGAHPDDESSIAGLLLKAKLEGKKTGIVCFTRGESGGFAEKDTRVKELKEAVEYMELDYFKHLEFPDAGVIFSEETVNALIPLLVESQPQVVITIHPDDYHPDHKAVSQTADRAVFVAGLKKHMGEKTWHPKQVLYTSLDKRSNKYRPDIIVDITDVFEKKLEAAGCHKSQDIAKYVEPCARYYGGLGGFEYGEGLYIRQPL
ncbi:MAG: PIG-L family deacetylase, partial [Firmicutes bacterium]|nr:PIG-L family deacetylase [Bacillota bacterium]